MEPKRAKWLWDNDKHNAQAAESGNNGISSAISETVRLEAAFKDTELVQLSGHSIIFIIKL